MNSNISRLIKHVTRNCQHYHLSSRSQFTFHLFQRNESSANEIRIFNGIQYPISVLKIPQRSLFSKPTEKQQRNKDKIFHEEILIFKNGHQKSLDGAFSLVGLCTLPVILNAFAIGVFVTSGTFPDPTSIFYDPKLTLPLASQDHPLYTAIAGSAFGSMLWWTLRTIVTRSIIRLYFEPEHEKFIGIYRNWAMDQRRIEFTSRDIEIKNGNAIVGNLFGHIYIKGRPFVLEESHFLKPKFYNLLFGKF